MVVEAHSAPVSLNLQLSHATTTTTTTITTTTAAPPLVTWGLALEDLHPWGSGDEGEELCDLKRP